MSHWPRRWVGILCTCDKQGELPIPKLINIPTWQSMGSLVAVQRKFVGALALPSLSSLHVDSQMLAC